MKHISYRLSRYALLSPPRLALSTAGYQAALLHIARLSSKISQVYSRRRHGYAPGGGCVTRRGDDYLLMTPIRARRFRRENCTAIMPGLAVSYASRMPGADSASEYCRLHAYDDC